MKTLKLTLMVIALLLFGGVSYAQSWDLVWSDEFNYNGLPDASKWEFEVHGPGWVNNERQNYTNQRWENCRVENGRLVIEARRDWFNGHEYSSARIRSANRGDWTYGRIEVRAKLPAGRGTWPAIWMLPTDWSYGGWPASGEIDIMEYVGYQPDVVHASVHTRDRNFMNGNNFTVSTWNGTVEEDFHTYAVEWRQDRLDFFIDNTKYGTYTNTGGGWSVWPFDKRFHMILNVAIGGNWGGAQGIDNNIFPTRMEVDYVRVFKEGSLPKGDPNLAGTYYLQNRHSNLYADVEGASNNDGAKIHQWAYHGGTNQQFRFSHLGNGTYQVLAVSSGKSLDVANVSTADGAKIHQWGYGGGANQQFIALPAGDGFYKLMAKNSGKLVEVGGFSTVNGGALQQWGDAGQRSAHWKLIPVVPTFSTTIQAESYSIMAGVQREGTTDAGGGENVGYIDGGDWMAYNSITIPSTGSYKIEYRVASVSGGQLSLDLNGGSVFLGSVNVPATGGWQNWTTVSHTVHLNAGTYNFGIFAQTGGWNINWWRITRQNSSAKTSVADAQAAFELDFEFYPNPAAKELYLKSPNDLSGAEVIVYDEMGIEVLNNVVQSNLIDVSSLESGMYTVVISKDGNKITRRFVKQ